jgi:hypothetical protein
LTFELIAFDLIFTKAPPLLRRGVAKGGEIHQEVGHKQASQAISTRVSVVQLIFFLVEDTQAWHVLSLVSRFGLVVLVSFSVAVLKSKEMMWYGGKGRKCAWIKE